MDGGQTAHSVLKIPLKIFNDSTCNIAVNSDLAKMIQKATIIIWDEAVMTHKHVFMAVDRTLRDIMSQKNSDLKLIPFGNKIILFGGDFRQVLPVVKRGNRSAIVQSCLNKAPFWKHVNKCKLTENMRIKSASNNLGQDPSILERFSNYLISIGEGLESNIENSKYIDEINLPMGKNMDENELIKLVYPDIDKNAYDPEFMCSRAILAPKNTDVDKINELASNYFPGETKTYLSADSVQCIKQQTLYPTEFLNSITESGLPPHKLSLKIHQPVILLRNIAQSDGLCNGTKLIIKAMHKHFLDVEIALGKHKGKRFFIPKLSITPSDLDYPIELKRVQFPIRSAFSMTINKAQGSTLKKVGIYLNDPVFTHGQLYVALSRVSSMHDITIATNSEIGGNTRNVVYKEVFS